MRRYSSGQRGLTVNQMALAFAGSNPARRTHTKRHGSSPCLFVCAMKPGFEPLISKSRREALTATREDRV